jgi:hypothetical protein
MILPIRNLTILAGEKQKQRIHHFVPLVINVSHTNSLVAGSPCDCFCFSYHECILRWNFFSKFSQPFFSPFLLWHMHCFFLRIRSQKYTFFEPSHRTLHISSHSCSAFSKRELAMVEAHVLLCLEIDSRGERFKCINLITVG